MKISSIRFHLALWGMGMAFWGACQPTNRDWTMAGELERTSGPEDLSGMSHQAGDLYWFVGDNAGELHLGQLTLDEHTGRPTNFTIKETFKLAGADDLEGVAYDSQSKTVWVSDETGPAILEYAPSSHQIISRVTIPTVYGSARKNRGFEALALSPDGLSLWVCNENELAADDDGAEALSEFVRLSKFCRESKNGKWNLAGQWAYSLSNRSESSSAKKVKGEKKNGNKKGLTSNIKPPKPPKTRNGIADLCVLNDGRLLLLEREKTKFKKETSFRLAIYELDVTSANDISACATLIGSTPKPVEKRLVYASDTGNAMYEGLTQGPTLTDGSRTLILVSDGEKGAAKRLLVLKSSR